MDIFIPGNIFLVDVDVLCHWFLHRKAVSVAVHRKGMELMAARAVVNNKNLSQYLLKHFKLWSINKHFLACHSSFIRECIRKVELNPDACLPPKKIYAERRCFCSINDSCAFLFLRVHKWKDEVMSWVWQRLCVCAVLCCCFFYSTGCDLKDD